MRLEKIQQYLLNRGWSFQYCEQYGLGSIDFEYRGIGFHIWEFCQEPLERDREVQSDSMESGSEMLYGVESNLKNGGKMDEYLGDYEQELINELKNWR